jgi:hypothetical protein
MSRAADAAGLPARGAIRADLEGALRLEALQRFEDFLAQPRHCLAGAGELDAAAARVQQRRAHGVRELPQQARHGGLRERQFLGRARDATQAHARLEGDQLRQESVPEITSNSRAGHEPSPMGSLAQESR